MGNSISKTQKQHVQSENRIDHAVKTIRELEAIGVKTWPFRYWEIQSLYEMNIIACRCEDHKFKVIYSKMGFGDSKYTVLDNSAFFTIAFGRNVK